MRREARIADHAWLAEPDDGKRDDTTPFEFSRVQIDDPSFLNCWMTSEELTTLSKFFAEAALDLEEAGT